MNSHLLREFGIFCFGWIGGITGVFFLSYAHPENDSTLLEYFVESLPTIYSFLLLGASIFFTITFLRIAFGVWFE